MFYKKKQLDRNGFIFKTMEQIVPDNHLLRKIDKYIDFKFIYPLVEPYYCSNNGRNSIDPVVLFKILFIQLIFGIKSLRQTMRDVEVNVAYRWFLGIPFDEKIPHFSVIAQNYRRKFKDTGIYETIFNQIVLLAISKGYVDGAEIFTDSTHIKANANKKKFDESIVEVIHEKQEELEREVNKYRTQLGKKNLVLKKKVEQKKIKINKTDPESGYYCRNEKEKGFMYCDHRTVDGLNNIIIDAHITPGNVHDSVPFIDRVKHIKQEFNIDILFSGLDSGYNSTSIMKFLEEENIYSVIGYRRFPKNKEILSKVKFKWINESIDDIDIKKTYYICPQGETLTVNTITSNGYIVYRSNENKCKDCPLKDQCMGKNKKIREIRRHIYEDYRERNTERRLSSIGKGLYSRRKITVERSFADSKQNHGYRYAPFRGIKKVQNWAWLLCAAQNMKKIALLESRRA